MTTMKASPMLEELTNRMDMLCMINGDFPESLIVTDDEYRLAIKEAFMVDREIPFQTPRIEGGPFEFRGVKIHKERIGLFLDLIDFTKPIVAIIRVRRATGIAEMHRIRDQVGREFDGTKMAGRILILHEDIKVEEKTIIQLWSYVIQTTIAWFKTEARRL
jgi:hypothetical protein